jgi:uncharacterized coiled-coil DUF342 family protein
MNQLITGLAELEHDIEQIKFQRQQPITPPQPPLEDDLGRMSAEAVLTQYEAAAKAVEEMGDAVKERVRNIAGALLECDADMKEIAETAASIREKGKHVQVQIEEASALSSSIRSACIEFKKKVGLP